MTSFRFVVLSVALLLSGCAPALVAPPGTAVASARARDPIEVKTTGRRPYDFVLLRDGDPISQREFRRLYRAALRSDDLDELVMKRAKAKEAVMVLAGTGLTLLGAGGVALLSLPSAKCSTSSGCPKAVASSLIIGASGLYMVGCIAAKGARCLADGDVLVPSIGLTRAEAEQYTARYDAAVARRDVPQRTAKAL
jgi:hypothetical protein